MTNEGIKFAEYSGRNSAELLQLGDGSVWIRKVAGSERSERGLVDEFRRMEMARLGGVSVPQAYLTETDDSSALMMRWVGDRTFENAPSKAWHELGTDLANLHRILRQDKIEGSESGISYKLTCLDGLALEILEETTDRHRRLDLEQVACHGDFQIGNVHELGRWSPRSHAILDFEDVRLDAAETDLGTLAWSAWSHGSELNLVRVFVSGYQEAATIPVQRSLIPFFAVVQHCRWLNHLVDQQAPAFLIEKAATALIHLRSVAPKWDL